jgi:hypothetical protein
MVKERNRKERGKKEKKKIEEKKRSCSHFKFPNFNFMCNEEK